MSNNSTPIVDDSRRDIERGDNGGRQFASGGVPGMEMAVTPSAHENMPAELPASSPAQQDFLMIQLSSFEGRAN